VADDLVLPYAERLLACLCQRLATTMAGPVCRCCLAVGPIPPADVCCQCSDGMGQASVSVVNTYPTTNFPRPGVTEERRGFGPCGSFTWAAELALVVYRCVSAPGEDGAPPSCADQELDVRRLLDDARAMREAVSCCDWRGPASRPARISAGSWAPLPIQGGCGGGQMTVVVEAGGNCCPPDEEA
jgi:hypothetical protein